MRPVLLIILFLLFTCNLPAQRTREVQVQNQFWWSINTNIKIANKWSILADFHNRRTNFFANTNFFFLRLGAAYKINEQISVASGAGQLWLANRSGATEFFSNETRLYQQLQLGHTIGQSALNNTFRIEERWQQKVVNGTLTDVYRYSTRFRYQIALNIPVSKKKYVPSIAIADEILLQAGKDIIYNSFDQNRLFAGIKQQITPTLSFDAGYMLVYQQRLSGYQYNRNHTMRLFFYWKPLLKKKQQTKSTAFHLTEE